MTSHPHRDWPRRWKDDPAARAGILRDWRARCGYTQAELADRLGAGLRTVEDWEGERRTPPAYLLFALKTLGKDR